MAKLYSDIYASKGKYNIIELNKVIVPLVEYFCDIEQKKNKSHPISSKQIKAVH